MRNTATLFFFEFKKIICRKTVWAVGVLMLLLCAFLSISDLVSASVYYEVNGMEVSGYEMMKINRQNAKALSGRLINDALLQDMKKAYSKDDGTDALQPYAPVYSFVSQIMGDGRDVLDASADDIYSEREKTLSANRSDQMLSEEEADYWEKRDAEIKTPFAFSFTDGWSNMWEYAYTLNYMLLLLLAICLSNVFSIEYVRKTDAIILCSRYGKTQLYCAKLLAGSVFGIMSAFLLFGAALLSSLLVYGTDGLHAALQIAFPTATRNMTVGEAVGMLSLLFILMAILYSAVIMFLSMLIKNSTAVMAIPVGVMLLTMLVDIPYQFRAASQIYDLLPTNLLVKWELWDDRLVSVGGKFYTNFQIAPLLYILTVLLLVIAGKRKYQKYQITVR